MMGGQRMVDESKSEAAAIRQINRAWLDGRVEDLAYGTVTRRAIAGSVVKAQIRDPRRRCWGDRF